MFLGLNFCAVCVLHFDVFAFTPHAMQATPLHAGHLFVWFASRCRYCGGPCPTTCIGLPYVFKRVQGSVGETARRVWLSGSLMRYRTV